MTAAYGNPYPTSLEEIVRDVKYKTQTLKAVEEFKESGPWRGELPLRMQKFVNLHERLCEIYNIKVTLRFDPSVMLNENSGRSNYDLIDQIITLHGRLSVLTFLHEWGHVLKGVSEYEACIWSVNLFRRVFPSNFERLRNNANGHFLSA